MDRGQIDPEFARRLNALVAASGGRVSIGNSYRSTARQEVLWQAALKKYGSEAAARKWVAKPGHSKHQEGIAADLKGDLKWVAANAARFGLYQPMAHEPWHFELAGSRGTKDSRTSAPKAGELSPGNPDALIGLEYGDEELTRRGTVEGQLANLVAAISVTPSSPTAMF